jgi:hypothetical protein
MALSAAVAVVVQVSSRGQALEEVVVDLAGRREAAINYPRLTGELSVGDKVVVNTTAVELGLGTGGKHIVMARLDEPRAAREAGHIVKLRYTPWQFSCLAAEEQESPHHDPMCSTLDLAGMPVVACGLHSMIAGAAAGAKAMRQVRIAYVMTDRAALPLALSRLVADLRAKSLLDATITCGQAFGGDLEAVNLFSALIAARAVARADMAIVCQGPGNVGTDTPLGFSGLEQGEIINAASALGGRPVAVARVSFADKRERHQALSHHTATALAVAAIARAVLVLPEMAEDRMAQVMARVRAAGIDKKHEVVVRDGEQGLQELRRRGVQVESMGRSVEQDPEFFLASCAAGAYAAELLSSTPGASL